MSRPAPLPYLNPALFKEPELTAEEHDRIQLAKESFGTAFSEMLDRTIEHIGGNAGAQQWVAQEAAMLAMLLASLKTVELSGGDMERRQILSAFNFLSKRAQVEVPEAILAFAREVLREGQPH